LRRLLIWIISLISILWIVVSYLPTIQAGLPTLALPNSRTLALLALLGLVIFLVIQLWVVQTTVASVRAYLAKASPSAFHLRLDREFLWTALPILMTVGLAWASQDLWRNLFAP
jgi:heme/copper-type cytochrome/quinol oxidase subunit 2